MASDSPGARARARLGHPVVDADGHSQEYIPEIDAQLRKQGIDVGVHELITGLLGPDAHRWAALSPAERARTRALRPPWWAMPTMNTLDFATATMPGLLESRMDELGIDFGVVYPTLALGFPSIQNDELRLAACRAINAYRAELYAGHRRRLTPVALIPMHTPEEAIAALDPALLDRLFARHAGDRGWRTEGTGWVMRGAGSTPVDDWAALEVAGEADLVELFVPRFYFGCEADDPMTGTAFDARVNPFGSRLRAMLGSDIGHWDVPDMREVVAELLEPIEKGWLTEADVRAFAFENPVRFYTDTNPRFFEGTAVEGEV
ncbi:hypothetical protein K2X89_16295, partial [Myxococcota bacterium]|nr:hypothetical protein [Myxococcota bacterium]